MYSGVGRFPSIALVVFWLPLAFYIAHRRREFVAISGFDRIYSWWLTACLVTLLVSVMFDTYNVAYSMIRWVP